MLTIDLNAGIEDLWEIWGSPSEQHRLVVVYDSKQVVGIVTDANLRKYIVDKNKLPTKILEICRTDFIFVNYSEEKQDMIKQLINQLRAREASHIPSVNEIVLLEGSEAKIVPYDYFEPELSLMSTEYVVIGLGYVGLTLAALLNHKGFRVSGVEKNEERINNLISRKPYVYEPSLEKFLYENDGINISKTLIELKRSRLDKRVYIIAVNTKANEVNVIEKDSESVLLEIAKDIKRGDSIIFRSTLPVGYTNKYSQLISSITQYKVGIDIFIGFAPERTVEGNAIIELEKLPQIISGVTESCLKEIRKHVENWTPNLISAQSTESAELAKLINNAYRDYIFAFSNEVAYYCSKKGLDVDYVVELANQGYSRSHIPRASNGVGGPCLSKDSHILVSSFEELPEYGKHSAILAARNVNVKSVYNYANLIIDEINRKSVNLERIQILLTGLAFKGKPRTNDWRNSPSIELGQFLDSKGFEMFGWDSLISSRDINETWLKDFSLLSQLPEVVILANNSEDNLNFLMTELNTSKNKIEIIGDPWNMLRENEMFNQVISRGISVVTISKTFHD